MEYLNCYVCNSETKLQNSVRIRSKTKYSGVGVHEVIQSFLKESHVLRFSPNDIVCEQCFQKVNRYDLACRMADEIQQEITGALFTTEQEYLNEQSVEYLEFSQENDKTICEKDFEELQEQYDVQNSLDKSDKQTDDLNVIILNDDHPLDEDVESYSIKLTNIEEMQPLRRRHTACDECDISFNTKRELRQHQIRYHMPKKCGVCQMVFANQIELKTHARQDHEIEHLSNDEAEFSRSDEPIGENENNFRCEICGITENTNNNLAEHIALHENQLKCVVCGTILKHKANLILHMRIHADKKFFKCDKCEKTFVHKSSLRMHLQTTHTEIRNKQCPECPLKFKTTSQLNQHLVTHTGVKKHECPECGKAFGQKYNMTAHYKCHFANKIQRQTHTKTNPSKTIKI